VHCESEDFNFYRNGPHLERRCAACGKFQKFDKWDFTPDGDEPAAADREQYAIGLTKRWKLQGKHMTNRQVEAIITVFEERQHVK